MFRNLNEIGKYNNNLIKSRMAEINLKPAELATFFHKIKVCHKSYKYYKKFITFFSVITCLSVIIVGIISLETNSSFLYIVTGFSLVSFITLRFIAAKLKKGIFNQELIDSASPYILNLIDDFKDETEVQLILDFRGDTHEKKQHCTKKLGNGFVNTYRDPWFSGYAYLADKTLLQWEFTTITKHKRVTKRSRSGKRKTKDKYKRKYANSVTVFRKTHSKLKAKNHFHGNTTTKIKVKEGKVAVKKIRHSKLTIDVNSMMKLTQSAFREFKKG